MASVVSCDGRQISGVSEGKRGRSVRTVASSDVVVRFCLGQAACWLFPVQRLGDGVEAKAARRYRTTNRGGETALEGAKEN